ncbi:hypothetical protein P692DRAFT_20708612, partial [Suillus brevipes Sb2]
LRPSDLKFSFCSPSPSVLHHVPVMLIRDEGKPRLGVCTIRSTVLFRSGPGSDRVSQINKLSAVWTARFANTPSSSVGSNSRTPQTRRNSYLGNLYQV